jgi:hypothetical protein
MAQDSGSQNQTGATPRSQIITGLVLLAVVLVGIYFATRSDDGSDNGGQNNQSGQEQTDNQNPGNNQNPGQQPTDSTDDGDGEITGDEIATGTLRNSDDAAKGNYMLESNRGKIYVRTSRDYSDKVGEQVSLRGTGSLNNFTFLGFSGPGQVADGSTDGKGESTDVGDVGGAPEETGDSQNSVTFTGVLRYSDANAYGNYMVVSGSTKVYLQSARNYNAWVGTKVTLDAVGTLDNFHTAILRQ